MQKKKEVKGHDHLTIVKDDKVVMVQAPASGFGETTITWQKGKAIRVKTSENQSL